MFFDGGLAAKRPVTEVTMVGLMVQAKMFLEGQVIDKYLIAGAAGDLWLVLLVISLARSLLLFLLDWDDDRNRGSSNFLASVAVFDVK